MYLITLSKIAKLANVSVSTASKAFSGSTEVSEDTKELIFEIAKKHGCFKKFYNVKYPKLVIAIIVPEFRGTYYSRYLSFIQSNLENCELCVSTTNFSAEKEKALIEYYYKNSSVDGIIVISPISDLTDQYEIPVVLVGANYQSQHAFAVIENMKSALMKSVSYLLDKNVSSIGFIGEKHTDGKLKLLQEVLNEKGIPLENNFVSISEDRFEEGGYSAMEALFSRQRVPRAIVCAYDDMAIGAIRCIYEHGLSAPKDIAILGFDNNDVSAFFNPPIASIASNIEEIYRIATDAILDYNSYNSLSPRIVTSDFILRKSFELY